MWIYIVLAVLLLLLCLLFLKVNVRVLITNAQTKLFIEILWFKIDVMEKIKKASSKKEKNKEDEEKESGKEKKDVKESFQKFSGLLSDVLERAKKVLKGFTKKLDVQQFALNISFAASDAAVTGILYGAFCAGVYPLLGKIDDWFSVREKEVVIRPCFDKEAFFEGRFESLAGMKVHSMLGISLRALWHFVMKDKFKKKQMKKAV